MSSHDYWFVLLKRWIQMARSLRVLDWIGSGCMCINNSNFCFLQLIHLYFSSYDSCLYRQHCNHFRFIATRWLCIIVNIICIRLCSWGRRGRKHWLTWRYSDIPHLDPSTEDFSIKQNWAIIEMKKCLKVCGLQCVSPYVNDTRPSWWLVSVCSDNRWVPPGIKSVPETTLTKFHDAMWRR